MFRALQGAAKLRTARSLAFAVKTNSAKENKSFSNMNKKRTAGKKSEIAMQSAEIQDKTNSSPKKEKSHAAPPPTSVR